MVLRDGKIVGDTNPQRKTCEKKGGEREERRNVQPGENTTEKYCSHAGGPATVRTYESTSDPREGGGKANKESVIFGGNGSRRGSRC